MKTDKETDLYPLLTTLRARARQPFSFSATRWPYFLFPGLTLVLLSLGLLDRAAVEGQAARPAALVLAAERLTDLTTAPWILSVALTLALVCFAAATRLQTLHGKWRALICGYQALYVFTAVGASSLSVNIIKHLLGRARPSLIDLSGILNFRPGGWVYDYASFPSGHSTTAGAIFVALALLKPKFAPGFVSLAIFFAFARVAVGAHYPSDIFAGLFYGAWVSVAVACAFAHYRLVFATAGGRFPHPCC